MKSTRQNAGQSLSASFSPRSIVPPTHLIHQRRILITGAGGSIGSALAHTIAACHPAQIVLLESSEQALYQVDRQLAAPHTSVLADICDKFALEETFQRHYPQIVFHAAAFKHVPLMELHPFAAMQNNAVGTFTLVETALRHRAAQIILVSTDKAADPAGMMGASKRIAELVGLALSTPATRIKAVRLCNVYSSQGSVVPLFQEQIAQGRPVTVTHAEATRYFITLEQAAALLLLALSEEFPSAILVPNLNTPVRIEQIARSLIEQSGSVGQIVYTGLRPGEKLQEQLLSSSESYVSRERGPLNPIQSDGIATAEARRTIDELKQTIRERDLNRLLQVVTALIPTYRPSETLQQAPAGCRA